MTLEDDDFNAEDFLAVDAVWRRGLEPEPQLTVSEWADLHRLLPTTNAEPGPWRTLRVPYLREIMDCLSTSSPVERIVFMKGAQTGGTEASLNGVGFWMHHAPGTILVVWPSLDMVRRNSRTRIDPLIEGTPALRALVAPAKVKDSANTISQKEFAGGTLAMVGANSATGLRSLPVRYLVMDEVDAFPADADGEGDPVALAVQRTVTFRVRRKIMLISTPTNVGASRIEQAYKESDQRQYFVPCLACGAFQPLKWSGVRWPQGEPAKAFYACAECGGVIEEHTKPRLLAAGEWRATKPGDGRTAGFHLSALYSPFESWGEIATEFLQVHKDPLRLRVWTNTKLGECFQDRESESASADKLLAGVEEFDDRLDERIAVITAGVDVQDDRLALEVIGWGDGEESWSLDYSEIWGDTSAPDVWASLDAELLRYHDHPRAGRMPVRAVCIDSGGHRTQQVYRFARERAGRNVWAIKGRGGSGVPVWPRRPPKAHDGVFTPYVIGVDAAKELVVARLRAEPGPGACHFPADRDLDYFRMLCSERIIRVFRRGVPVRAWWKDRGVNNEALDVRVYGYAALQGLVARGFRLSDESRRIRDLPVRDIMEPAPVAAPKKVIRSSWMER